MPFLLGFIAGFGATCLLSLIALAVLLHGDVQDQDLAAQRAATSALEEAVRREAAARGEAA